MPWNRVVATLGRAVAEMTIPGIGHKWVENLTSSDDGELLGICLAIDLDAESLTAPQLARILDDVASDADARSEFYSAVQRQTPPVRCVSHHSPHPPEAEPIYLRILEFGDFVTYYVKPVYGYTTEPGHLEMVRKLFLRPEGRTLHDIHPVWSGKHQIVWVIKRSEILADGPPRVLGDAAAREIADRLGLALRGGVGPENQLELVMIVYPPGFATTFQLPCCQPTTLDANWETAGTLYMSAGRDDAWGRTRSCSGTQPGLRERVHREIDKIDRTFVLFPLGVTDPPKVDRTTMTHEAYDRLMNGGAT